MSINIGPPVVDELKPKIAVIGVGGAGGNAIANMINARVEGVDFIVANTDAQALNSSPAEFRIQLGPDITQGLGAGSRPEVGRAAAEETLEQVKSALSGAHMCFIAAGMGGGTGTGAAPVIARAAREMNILTVGVVTKPFLFEGQRRMRSCEAGIAELQEHVDTLIVIPNQNLFLVANPNTTFKEAFLLADEVLQQGVRGITDLMVMPGLINLDFADVRSVMHEMGKAMMGTGEAEGDGRALEAAERAIANPLLDGVSMAGAKGVIISITGGEDMRLMEVDEAANHIRELVDPDANIIWGSAFNDNLNGKIRVSVVATGIDQDGGSLADRPARSFSFDQLSRPSTAAMTPAVSEAVESEAEAAVETVEELAEPSAAEPTGYTPYAAAATAVEETEEALEETTSAEDDVLELEASDHTEVGEAEGGDMLELGDAERAEDAGESGGNSSSENSDEMASEGGSRRRRLFGSDDASDLSPEPSSPPPRVSTTGGTLFERMTNLSRGLGRNEDEDDDDKGGPGLNIPRFLDRQSNN
jgi:cell division protein FtsZ